MRRLILFISLFLVLGTGRQAPASTYRELARDWAEWKPPVYGRSVSDQADGDRSLTDLPVTNRPAADSAPADQMGSPSVRAIWQSKLAGILDKGRFLPGEAAGRNPALAGAGTAAKAVSPVLDLKILEDIVVLRNPRLLAAQRTYEAELNGFDQVADLEAVLSRYAAFTAGVMPGVGPKKVRAGVPFPLPGPAALTSAVIVENVTLAALDLNMALRDKVTQARKAYGNLVFIYEKRRIYKETLDLYSRLHDIASTLYKTGKTSYQDVIQVTIREKMLQKEMESLGEQKKSLNQELLALMDLPWDTPVGAPVQKIQEKTPPRAGTLLSRALPRRQELIRMDHAISKMEIMIEMAESMVLPNRDLGLSLKNPADIATTGTWAGKAAFPDQGPQASMGAGSPKKPWFGTTESWLAQTRKKLAALRHKRQDIEAQTRAQIQGAWFRLDDALRTCTLYRDSILDLSASALAVSTREYEAGSITFSRTAGAYNSLLNARLAYAVARKDAAVFRAGLQKIVGFSF